ncbi:MAG: hypothetical protein HYY16_11385 [Planctomycetes bacterium]|nr:hypothetical protein [Planctomycetota bacterium]
MFRKWVLVILATGSSEAGAQTMLLSERFDDGAPGWTFDSSVPPVQWAADATPSLILQWGDAPFVSAPHSLNYNNGTDYGLSGANSGTATSPLLPLAGWAGVVVSFWCAYDTDGFYDSRSLEISKDEFATTVQELRVSWDPRGGQCETTGRWHQHKVFLEPSWGAVRLRFRFGVSDDRFRARAGWFIDDVEVIGYPFSEMPPAPTDLAQSTSPGGPAEPAGFVTERSQLYFRAFVSSGTGRSARILLEGERNDAPFDGLYVRSGNFTEGPGVSEAQDNYWFSGSYHWRCRAQDDRGLLSEWKEFDPAAGPDYTVQVDRPLPLSYEDEEEELSSECYEFPCFGIFPCPCVAGTLRGGGIGWAIPLIVTLGIISGRARVFLRRTQRGG